MPRWRSIEPLLQALQVLLAGQATRPGSRDLSIALGVCQETAARYVKLLIGRGIVLPPLVTPTIRCAVYPSLQDGVSGWQVSSKRPRWTVWLATKDQALQFKQAVGDGMAIAAARALVSGVVICPRCQQPGVHGGDGAACIEALKARMAARDEKEAEAAASGASDTSTATGDHADRATGRGCAARDRDS